MSWNHTLGSDNGGSQQMHAPNPQASGLKKLVHLSADGWEELKPSLIDLYETKGWKAQQINQWMRDAGYLTTPKMVMNHMTKWGIRRYQSSKDKDALCRQVLEDTVRGREMLLRDKKQLKKLQRHCKEKPEQTEEDKTLLHLLQEWETESAKCSDNSLPSENEDGSADVDQWYMIGSENQDFMFTQSSTSQSSSEFGNLTSFSSSIDGELAGVDVNSILVPPLNTGSNGVIGYRPQPIIRQPGHFGSKFIAIDKLLNLSQQYYNIKLQEYSLLRLQELNITAQGLSVGLSTDRLSNNTSTNRLFWRGIKNCIYYLKMGSEDLARQELTEAFQMIPILCERHPFSFIQEIHATLSPVATRIRPALRTDLLQAFRQNAIAKLGPNHRFSAICEILCTEEGSDELSTTVLQAMLDDTKKVLPPDQQELFELQRTIIRLYRRNRDFSKAEEMTRSLISTEENVHGKNHVNSRLALTEWVYILNDQNRYEESLIVAEDIVQRGQRDQGHILPDERDVYAMEDVAEICDKLGRINASIDWLRRASRAALSVWGNQTATVHVQDKLEGMHDKRYRQVLVTHMP